MFNNHKYHRIHLFILLIVLLLLSFSCKDRSESQVENINLEEQPDQEGWNSKSYTSSNGQMTAIIKYGHMKRFDSKKMAYFDEGIEIDFFDEQGQHTSKLKSNKGILDENTNNVEAQENVVVVSDSGITVETEKLWWDNAIEKVVSDQFVTITDPADSTVIYGKGFESDRTLTNYTIKEFRSVSEKKLNLTFDKQRSTKKDSSQDTTVSKIEKQQQ